MQLNKRSLQEWLLDQEPSEFPDGHDYRSGYGALVKFLDTEVQKHVNAANTLVDDGFLTDHGPDHIRKLIQRMGALVSTGDSDLSPYEVYILLVAANFHDVGNIFGRDKHEEQAIEVMDEAGRLLGIDSVERRCIYNIAQAHGGSNKDKLRELQRTEFVRNREVRVQALAAILKFADELAEDSDRAARFLLKKDALPEASKVYHTYAQCLNSVVVDRPAREVAMRFELRRSDVISTYLKPNKSDAVNRVYLLDEIFSRTLKTHFERSYCSRFMRPIVDVNAVRVNIEVTDDRGYNVLQRFSYRLEDTGYPDGGQDIYSICPDLNNVNSIGRLTGTSLARHLEE